MSPSIGVNFYEPTTTLKEPLILSQTEDINKKYLVQLYNLEAERINANAIRESSKGQYNTESKKKLKKLHI